MEVREEYKTSLIRGVATAALGSAIAFFNLWPQDVTNEVLISSTALAGLVPLGMFLGLGAADARRNDKA